MILYYTGRETQIWLDFSLKCKYLDADMHKRLYDNYDKIIGKLVNMSLQPDKWSF